MTTPLAVAGIVLAGALGTLVRAELAWWSRRRTGGTLLGTWLVNLAGALLLGVVVGLGERGVLAETTARVLGTGLLGGATTFSTWVVLVVRPDGAAAARHPARTVLVHGVGMLVAGVAAAAVGVALARAVGAG